MLKSCGTLNVNWPYSLSSRSSKLLELQVEVVGTAENFVQQCMEETWAYSNFPKLDSSAYAPEWYSGHQSSSLRPPTNFVAAIS